jgi:hypothetical protein
VAERRDGAPRLTELLERGWSRHGLKGVATTVVQLPGEANRWTAVVQATVETDRGAFSGLGEAGAEGAAPAPGARLIEEAEARALARALGWATNSVAAVGDAPAAVPAWLRADEGNAAPPAVGPVTAAAEATGAEAPAAPGQATARRPTDRAGRVLATAQSLWKACAARGVPAPEPDPGWDEARLQEYVATWSAELKQAATPDRARRS